MVEQICVCVCVDLAAGVQVCVCLPGIGGNESVWHPEVCVFVWFVEQRCSAVWLELWQKQRGGEACYQLQSCWRGCPSAGTGWETLQDCRETDGSIKHTKLKRKKKGCNRTLLICECMVSPQFLYTCGLPISYKMEPSECRVSIYSCYTVLK